MSKRFDERRCAAFLEALGVCGNVTLAAERCKVSRSWVALRRAEDAAFDQGCRGACREAKARLDRLATNGPSNNMPPSGWAYLDGVELVVRGSGGSGGGRRCQIGRARLHQWSARTEARFLAALAATCNVKAACAQVGMHATSAYAHRKRWSAFAKRWDEAIETGYVRIEMALLQNACNLFSADDHPPEERLPDMTIDQAIHVLHMHKNQVRGIGRRPGLTARPRTLDEVRDSILRKFEAIERWRAAQEGDEG